MGTIYQPSEISYYIRTLREQNAILNALNEPDPALSQEILAQHEKMKILSFYPRQGGFNKKNHLVLLSL
jgi:hypothetical protein